MNYFLRPRWLLLFFPQQLTANNNRPPEIVISDFRFGDRFVIQGQNTSLYQSLIKTKEIVLKYNQNIFSFDFAAIDYRDPEENRLLFKLENYDNSWRQGNERTAYYFDVPRATIPFVLRQLTATAYGERRLLLSSLIHGGVNGGLTLYMYWF